MLMVSPYNNYNYYAFNYNYYENRYKFLKMIISKSSIEYIELSQFNYCCICSL